MTDYAWFRSLLKWGSFLLLWRSNYQRWELDRVSLWCFMELCYWNVYIVTWFISGDKFNTLSKRPWARHWTPNCSWCAVCHQCKCKMCIHCKSHICKSLWIKASAKWWNVMSNCQIYWNFQFLLGWFFGGSAVFFATGTESPTFVFRVTNVSITSILVFRPLYFLAPVKVCFHYPAAINMPTSFTMFALGFQFTFSSRSPI